MPCSRACGRCPGAVLPPVLSRQVAVGMVDSLLDLARGTAQRLAQSDTRQVELLQRFGDRFWEELAAGLEQGGTLQRSQQLLVTLLQQLKLNYLAQMNRAGIDALMEELDELTSPVEAAASASADALSPGPPATPPA